MQKSNFSLSTWKTIRRAEMIDHEKVKNMERAMGYVKN